MSLDQSTPKGRHYIELSGRSKLLVGGVLEVSGFDETFVEVVTSEGNLTVEGQDLHMTDLSFESGKIAVEGRIDELVYKDSSTTAKEGLFRRNRRKK